MLNNLKNMFEFIFKKRNIIVFGLAIIFFLVVSLFPIFMLGFKVLNSKNCFDLDAFKDGRRLLLLWRSFYISSSVALICTLIGTFSAFCLICINTKLSHFLLMIFIIPLLISPFIHGIAWPNFLFEFNVKVIGEGWLIFLLILCYFSISLVMAYTSFSNIDSDLYLAGRLRYGKLKSFFKVTFRLSFRSISISTVIIFLLAMGEYGLPALLQVQTYPVEIMTEFSAFYDEIAAIKLCLPFIVQVIIAVVVLKYLLGAGYLQFVPNRNNNVISLDYSLCQKLAFTSFLLLVVLISVILPIFAICSKLEGIHSILKAWTSAKNQILYSLVFSFSTVLISIIPAWILAKLQLKTSKHLQYLFDFFIYLPFIMPGTLMGIGYISIWNRPQLTWIASSLIAVPLIYVGCFMPIMQKSIFISLSSIHKSINEVTSLAPQSWFTKWLQIDLFLARKGFIIGCMTIFFLSFRELNATILTLPPGVETLSLRTYTLSHYGADDMVMGLCLICIAVSVLLYLATLFLWKYFRFKRKISGN